MVTTITTENGEGGLTMPRKVKEKPARRPRTRAALTPKIQGAQEGASTVPSQPMDPVALTPDEEAADVRQLLADLDEQANRGDSNALQRLRDFLDQNPQVWEMGGDLTAIAERAC